MFPTTNKAGVLYRNALNTPWHTEFFLPSSDKI